MGNAYPDLQAMLGFETPNIQIYTAHHAQLVQNWSKYSIAAGQGTGGRGRDEGLNCPYGDTPWATGEDDCWNGMANAYTDLWDRFCGGTVCSTPAHAAEIKAWWPTSAQFKSSAGAQYMGGRRCVEVGAATVNYQNGYSAGLNAKGHVYEAIDAYG